MLSTVICVSFEWLALQVTNENGLCDLRACLPTNFTAGMISINPDMWSDIRSDMWVRYE